MVIRKTSPCWTARVRPAFLLHRDLTAALANADRRTRVGDLMRRDVLTVQDSDPLDRVIDQMQSQGQPLAFVECNGELVGLLSEEHIGQWVMLHSSMPSTGTGRPRTDTENAARDHLNLP